MKIKFDPTLITALSYLLTYFRKVKLIKYLIIKPFKFLVTKLGKLLGFTKVITNFKLYKLYRKITRLFSIYNILVAIIMFLIFNDLSIEDILVLGALIYTRIFDYFTDNVLSYIYNIFNIIKGKLFNLLEPSKVSKVKSKINKSLDREFKDNIFASGYKLPKLFDDNEVEVEIKKAFYYSPYFYVPAGIIITGVTIYFCYDSFTPIVTGILAYFGFNNDDDNRPGPSSGSTSNEVGLPIIGEAGPSRIKRLLPWNFQDELKALLHGNKPWKLDTSNLDSLSPETPSTPLGIYAEPNWELSETPDITPLASPKQPEVRLSSTFEDRFRGSFNDSFPSLSEASGLNKGKGKAKSFNLNNPK